MPLFVLSSSCISILEMGILMRSERGSSDAHGSNAVTALPEEIERGIVHEVPGELVSILLINHVFNRLSAWSHPWNIYQQGKS